MSEMERRITLAIEQKLNVMVEPGRTTTIWELAAECAPAVLAAIHKPTNRMIEAGVAAANKVATHPIGGFIADETWRAMIDAALAK